MRPPKGNTRSHMLACTHTHTVGIILTMFVWKYKYRLKTVFSKYASWALEGWKGSERLLPQNPRVKRTELLAKVAKASHELRTKEIWTVPDNLCLENNPWDGAKLWNQMVRVWRKKGATLWNTKIEREMFRTKAKKAKFPSGWSSTLELPAKECPEF